MKHGFDVVAVIPFFSLRCGTKFIFSGKKSKRSRAMRGRFKTNFFGFHSIFNLSRNFIPKCCWRRKKSLKPEKSFFKLFGSSFVKTSKIDFVRNFFPPARLLGRTILAAKLGRSGSLGLASKLGWRRGVGDGWRQLECSERGLKPISKRKNGFKMRMRKPTLIFLEAKKSILGFFSSLEVKFVAASIV